jgi:molybdopterin/thiamine biosynthesis adenylyltransferase
MVVMTDSQAKDAQSSTVPETENSAGRYARQMCFGPIGGAGQQRLLDAKVTLIGCGALGTHLAGMMTRAGVGRLTIVDRDFIELNNLQRQILFDENDIAENLPKAEAAARKLRRINSAIEINPIVADVNHESIEHFVEGADLILDGTDNLQVRFLINDVALKHKIPWIYGACIGASGMGLVVMPGGKPCLRCLFEEPPDPGQLETCETAGILSPTVAMVAAFQAVEALKILTGNIEAVNRDFVTFELWENRSHQMSLANLKNGCATCRDGNYEFLTGRGSLSTISLCGRNSVQVRPRHAGDKIDLADLARRLSDAGVVICNDFMLRFQVAGREITIFPDARAIVKGTNNIDEARSLYAKYVGH